jgi:sodium-coupled neutral amino acid transporter 11
MMYTSAMDHDDHDDGAGGSHSSHHDGDQFDDISFGRRVHDSSSSSADPHADDNASISSSQSTLSFRASLDNLRLAAQNQSSSHGHGPVEFRDGHSGVGRTRRGGLKGDLEMQHLDASHGGSSSSSHPGGDHHDDGGDDDGHHFKEDAPDRWTGYSLSLAPKPVLGGAIANLANAITTAGLCGIPFAVAHSGGIIGGILFMVVFACVADFSFQSLVQSGLHFNALSYGSLCKRALGPKAELVQRVSVLLLAIGTMANYLIIVRDTVPESVSFGVRFLVLLAVTVFIVLPLCSAKNLEALSKTSIIALIVAVMVVLLLAYYVFIDEMDKADPDYLKPPHQGLSVAAMGAVAFAYVAHHTSFHLFGPIYTNTPFRNVSYSQKGWNVVANSSLFFCTSLFVLETIFAIALFGRDGIHDNILLHSNVFNLPIRIIIICPMLLTFPVEGIVARDTIHSMILNPLMKKKDSATARVIVSFAQRRALLVRVMEAAAMNLVVFIMAISIKNLSIVQNITGGVAASMLGFILPGLCMAKQSDKKIKGYAVASFGLLILVCALAGEAYNLAHGH